MNVTIIVAIFLAFITKGVAGFANTLVFGSIMSFSTNTINITPIDLLIGLPSNVMITFKERKNIYSKIFIPLSILVILGTIPGTLLLKNADVNILKVIFGFVVILLSIETLLREKQIKKTNPNKLILAIIGAVSGVLCGMFGIGAFLVAYVGRTTENQAQFRGNICAVFLVENIFRIFLYSINGIINKNIVLTSIKLLPIMLLGLGVGILLSKIISEKIVKKIVMIMLMLTGISLVISNLM